MARSGCRARASAARPRRAGDRGRATRGVRARRVDIPSKFKRNPARAAAVIGGVGFVASAGRAAVQAGRIGIVGPDQRFRRHAPPRRSKRPSSALGRMGKSRGTLERDFADYLKGVTEAARARAPPDALLHGHPSTHPAQRKARRGLAHAAGSAGPPGPDRRVARAGCGRAERQLEIEPPPGDAEGDAPPPKV